jgi:predicted CoA-binding protein
MSDATDIETLKRILQTTHSIAMVGLSDKWHRPSYFVAKYLLDRGYKVIPVNPGHQQILGQKCYPTLEDIPDKVDMVDLFQRPDRVMPFVESAIDMNVRFVWMQLGIVNEEAAAKARAQGIEVVMDRCPKIEYARLFGGLNWVGVNTGIISAKRPKHVN